MTPSDRLICRISAKLGPYGLSDADIAGMEVSPDAICDLRECLSADDASELKWGLIFAHALLERLPTTFVDELKRALPKLLRHSDWDVRNVALSIFVRLRDHFPEYRDVMMRMLKDTAPPIRANSLRQFRTFMDFDDIASLIEFSDDDYIAEVRMNGPLVYVLRNEALRALEDLARKQFQKSEKVALLGEGLVVYWWDWEPALTWWRAQKRF